MKVLGFSTLPIGATCTARQDFVNTDVVLVLDTTGSMNCLPTDGPSVNCPTEKSGSKIQALRSAVTAFYNALKPAQDTLEAKGLRLRYGVVPYSSNVNVGKLLLSTNPGWLNQSSYYRNCSTAFSNGSLCPSSAAPRLVDHGAVSTSTPWWNSTWSGCIEERQTVNSITTSSGYTPPSNAYDLDLSMVPTSDPKTKWNAHDPASEGVKYTATSGNPTAGYACPSPALNLQAVPNVATMNSYTNSLVAVGGTYHDIGLMWGGRMLAQNGLWASNNPSTYNGFPVNRDIIFMTDGALDTQPFIYSAWGYEQFDRRATTTGVKASDDDTHLQRFRMMCNAVKGMNVNIWVIAFGTSAGTGLSAEMVNCASSSSQAFKASNQADLVAQFTQIGQTIGALRLSQ